jgi:hypothetical protein
LSPGKAVEQQEGNEEQEKFYEAEGYSLGKV